MNTHYLSLIPMLAIQLVSASAYADSAYQLSCTDTSGASLTAELSESQSAGFYVTQGQASITLGTPEGPLQFDGTFKKSHFPTRIGSNDNLSINATQTNNASRQLEVDLSFDFAEDKYLGTATTQASAQDRPNNREYSFTCDLKVQQPAPAPTEAPLPRLPHHCGRCAL